MPPLISVIMCTYNGEQFLDEQISSILSQDYPHFELIIVDDHSTDGTWEKLLEWQTKNDIIKVSRNEINLGYNRNFEKAIPLGKGGFISIADQDDTWLPQKLSRTMNAFTDARIVLAHCKSVRYENNELKYRKANLHYHFSGNDTRKLFLFNQMMGHDMIFRKELVPKILPIPKGMSYDWWIAVVATCYGHIAAVDEFLVHHRIHSRNNFFSPTAASKRKELDIEDTLRLFLNIPALQPDKRAYLESFLQLLSDHNRNNTASFDFNLFRFLYRNRKIIFGHKRRLLPELSYLKNAFKYASLNYNGRGMSI